jgi:DNA-binding PadR family transcriptional regulator
MHHLHGIFHELRHHLSGDMRHRGKHHRRGRGFGPVFGDRGESGFDRSGFRTGRKLAGDDLQLLLLALIAEKPSHGYDLIKVLEERSGGYYVPSPGMIYPALTYLEEAGHATVEPEGTKKLYRISEDGKAHLDENRDLTDELLTQLDRIGRKMKDVQRAFTGDQDEGSEEGDTNELRQARRELRRVLRERKRGNSEESRRIAEILRRATAEIVDKS